MHVLMALDAKRLQRHPNVRRAVAMLEPDKGQILGKADAVDKAWKEGRNERLMNALTVKI